MRTYETYKMEFKVRYEDGTVELVPIRAATIADGKNVAMYDTEHGAVETATFVRYIED